MAKKVKLSATRISTFLRCKQKYWFSYVDKLPKISNPAFKLGLACHESLELAGKIWMDKGEFSKADVKKILEKYDEISVREGMEDMTIRKEGKELVKRRLKNFMTGQKLIGLEFKFGFGRGTKRVTTDDGIELIGAIDKVEEIDEDTLLIIDYKTSKTAPTADQMRDDMQLSIYDLVASKVWPQYKRIILSLDLLKDEMLYTYRTIEEREEFSKYLTAVHDQMASLEEGKVKADLNMFCPWCDFKDYCSTYQAACKKSNYNFLPVMHYSDEQLIEEWQTVRAVKKILDNRERELGMVMTEKIKENSSNLNNGEEQIYIRQNSRTTYDPYTVVKYVPQEDLSKIVNINKKAIENYIEANPTIKKQVMETATTNFTSPFLAVRKNRN